MDTIRNSVSGMTGSNTTNLPAFCWTADNGDAATNRSRITDDMFARIPALLLAGTTKAEIAAMYGVTLNTLVVLCSRRGISLRKGGSRITDDMFARIPALLLAGKTKTEIAAMYGVTLGTLVVLCSRRGISLQKGGPLPKRTNLTLSDEPLPLSDCVLKSLSETARAMRKDSTARLISDLLEKIVSDGLYKAVLDEEAA